MATASNWECAPSLISRRRRCPRQVLTEIPRRAAIRCASKPWPEEVQHLVFPLGERYLWLRLVGFCRGAHRPLQDRWRGHEAARSGDLQPVEDLHERAVLGRTQHAPAAAARRTTAVFKCAVSTTTRRVGVLPDELSGRVDPVLVTNLDVHDDPEVLNVARGRHLTTSALEASLIPSGASPHTRPPLATFSAGQACCNRTCHESRLSHLTGSADSATATAPGVGACRGRLCARLAGSRCAAAGRGEVGLPWLGVR